MVWNRAKETRFDSLRYEIKAGFWQTRAEESALFVLNPRHQAS